MEGPNLELNPSAISGDPTQRIVSPERYLPLIKKKYSLSQKRLKKQAITPSSRPEKKSPTIKIPVFESPKVVPMAKYHSPSPNPQDRLDFFESFKNLSKYTQRNKYQKLQNSPKLAYLEDLEKNNLNPKPFGMINNGLENVIDLHFLSIGDSYAHAFSEGLKHFKSLERLNLKSNRLSEKGFYMILSNLENHPVRYLSLNDNILGERSFDCILSILKSSKPYLKHLNLENTRIPAGGVVALAGVLCSNQSLTFLSLAKNNLNAGPCKALKEMLQNNNTLKKLDLHWNCIRSEGAVLIFEGLTENKSLKALDLSWNSIGCSKDLSFMNRISENLSKQTYLEHLDLSHSYISLSECEILQKGLENNHTLLGFHIAGNPCFVDSKGFLVIDPDRKPEEGHFFKRIIGPQQHMKTSKTNCWICEGWKEVTFIWKMKFANGDPAFLHLECDNYQPELMICENDTFKLTRAVPQGQIKFFFSHFSEATVSQDYNTETLKFPYELEANYWEGFVVPLKMVIFNTLNSEKDPQYFSQISEAKPRIKSMVYIPPEEDLERIPWSIPISLFKDYRFIDQTLLTDCFEFDWNISRLSNLIKIPLQQSQIKEFLHEHYESIYYTYKTLSSLGGSEIFSIGSNVLTDFLNECKLIDDLFGPSDIGVNWNACITPKEKGQIYNPGNGLVRYEFLEILVRIAYDRYVRNKICGNILDATRKMFLDYLIPIMKNYDTSIWRNGEYLCEDVDLVFKAYKIILDQVYKKYSGKKTLPGQKVFMCMEEFRDFCRDAKLENERCTAREIDLAFSLAMMCQADELYKKRHIEMSYVEFLEAFARVCAASGNVRRYPKNEKDQIKEFYVNASVSKVHQIIEDAMPNLLMLCPQSLREMFVFPTAETYKKMMYRKSTKS
ncbi:hypothetical protein SteCoe_19157 [Stentor coeruleus]|uniref:Uncharacterized protein n=1 Tax=Stentor coeruleus TaxID=5963 RepID=A0A1R2BV40_9CILI|nr:hypothetical protein SteCoe_19157 [Stentor coeruleus]